MNTNELTADYICEDEDRLELALHVYGAMPAVRKYLIKEIFKAAGERVRVAEKLDDDKLECYEESVFFCTEETGATWIFAALEHGKRGVLQLYAGVYAANVESIKEAQREQIGERFRTHGDLGMWSSGKSFSSGNCIAYAYVNYENGGRWHYDDFLKRAIRSRDEVVSSLEELLLRIYRCTFPLPPN